MTQDDQTNTALHLDLYRMLVLIRRCQETIMNEYHPADEMRCPVHFCVGQEATPAALSLLMRPNDVVMSHHRSHGYYLAKGGSLDGLIAELYGKATGANGGLAGSQELSSHDVGFFSGTILSGMFAMATGAAFAQKYRASDGITVAVIGDGGMEEGIVFEALNLSAVFRLPILFVCENNIYSAHTRIDRRSLSETVSPRAAPFGVLTHILDGNDPILLARELAKILGHIRKNSAPAFVEVVTYRTCGHVGPENDDVLNYRPSEELLKWKERDPLAILRKTFLQSGIVGKDLEAIEKGINREILAAIKRAKEAPFPKIEDALRANWSNATAPVVGNISNSSDTSFRSGQAETRLAPY